MFPLAYPPVAASVLLVVACVAWWRRRRMFAVGLLAAALGWMLVWSLPTASDWLAAMLGAASIDESAMPHGDAIVVLGGGGNTMSVLGRGDPWSDALRHDRVAAGARLWQQGKAPWIVLSGGFPRATRRSSEAESMARAITRLGVPAHVLLLEARSRNTAENARFTARLACERGFREVILVTASTHMARARALFEREGLRVIPAPVPAPPLVRATWRERWFPSTRAWNRSEELFKEIAGFVLARLALSTGGPRECER